MKDKNLTRREKEKLRQRSEIIEAALALFSEKGFHNVSMQEISAKSEFAMGTLYKFFKNKESLYKEIVRENSEKFFEGMEEAFTTDGDEIEQLKNYIRVKNRMFKENLEFVRLYAAESRGVSFTLKKHKTDESINARYLDMMKKLAAVFDEGFKNKRFEKISDPFHLAVALDSTLISFYLLWLDDPELYSFPEDPDDVLNIFSRGLLAK